MDKIKVSGERLGRLWVVDRPWRMWVITPMVTNETSYPNPTLNIRRITSKGWVSLSMAEFVLLEDVLAFDALGNLPGAHAADLTMSPPASMAV